MTAPALDVPAWGCLMRNPPWDSDERALALDLYLRRGMVDKRDPELCNLSEFLNERARRGGLDVTSTFRNPAGVALKLANFAALDPAHAGHGMKRYSRGDAETFARYAGDTDELAVVVDQVLRTERTVAGHDLLDLEDDATTEYVVTIDQAVRLAKRQEAGLVRRFGEHLREAGHRVGTHHHAVAGGVLRIDLVDETDGRIWEAKYEVGRSAIRLAIGQLADYRRFEPRDWKSGILLPRRPSDDLVDLCFSVDAALAWQDGDGGFEVEAA